MSTSGSDSARPDTVSVEVKLVSGAPAPSQLDALTELAQAAEEADGNPPFSEQTLVELHKAADLPESQAAAAPLRIAYAWTSSPQSPEANSDAGSEAAPQEPLLAGAGVVVTGDSESPDVLELVVRPNCRQHGVGGALAEKLADDVLAPQPGRIQRAWAHGEHDAAARLATRFEWAPVRELWRMRLTNLEDIPSPRLPESVTLRSFKPGKDEEAWLKANAAAFADHPEQGRLTIDDLKARMAEEWFDPSGFLLAEERTPGEGEPKLLSFHWTKVHSPDESTADGSHSEPIGEVYVVGVVPEAQGRGLGLSLTLAGIEHLRNQGLGAIMLYVDADNTAAVELYKKLGFTRWDVDIMYAPIVEPTAESA